MIRAKGDVAAFALRFDTSEAGAFRNVSVRGNTAAQGVEPITTHREVVTKQTRPVYASCAKNWHGLSLLDYAFIGMPTTLCDVSSLCSFSVWHVR